MSLTFTKIGVLGTLCNYVTLCLHSWNLCLDVVTHCSVNLNLMIKYQYTF